MLRGIALACRLMVLLAFLAPASGWGDEIMVWSNRVTGTIEGIDDEGLHFTDDQGKARQFPTAVVRIVRWEAMRKHLEKAETLAGEAGGLAAEGKTQEALAACVQAREALELISPLATEERKLAEQFLKEVLEPRVAELSGDSAARVDSLLKAGRAKAAARAYEEAWGLVEEARAILDGMKSEAPAAFAGPLKARRDEAETQLAAFSGELVREMLAAGWVLNRSTGKPEKPSRESVIAEVDALLADRGHTVAWRLQEDLRAAADPLLTPEELDALGARILLAWARQFRDDKDLEFTRVKVNQLLERFPASAEAAEGRGVLIDMFLSEAEHRLERGDIAGIRSLAEEAGTVDPGGPAAERFDELYARGEELARKAGRMKFARAVGVLLAALALLVAGRLFYSRAMPGGIQRRCAREVFRIQPRVSTFPDAVEKRMGKIQDVLAGFSERGDLTPWGRKGLAAACLTRGAIQLARGDESAAREWLDKARTHDGSADWADMAPLLAGGAAPSAAVGALYQVFIGYLSRPRERTNAREAAQVEAALRSLCEITEETPESDLQSAIRWNMAASRIPASGPRLVVFTGAKAGRQIGLRDRILLGTGDQCDIRVSETSIPPEGAEVVLDKGSPPSCHVSCAGRGPRPKVNGKEVWADPVPLKENDLLEYGDHKSAFYWRPRAFKSPPAWPHFHLGVGMLRTEALQHALTQFTDALDMGMDTAEVRRLRGMTNAKLGRREDALADFAEAVRRDPASHAAFFARGQLRLAASQEAAGGDSGRLSGEALAGALADFKQAAALAPRHPDYWVALAQTHEAAGNYTESAAALQRAMEGDGGNNPDLHLLEARLALRLGDQGRALRSAQAAVDAAPDRKDANLLLGTLQYDLGEYEAAARHLRAACELEGKAPDNLTRRTLFQLGHALFETGDYERALAALQAVAGVSYEATVLMGRTLARSGSARKAAKCLAKAVKARPDDPGTLHCYASALAAANAPAEACEAAGRLRQFPDWEARALLLEAKIYLLHQDFARAEDRLQAAARLAPQDPDIALERVRAAFLGGDFRRAEGLAGALAGEHPDDPRGHDWLGRALFAQDRRGEARRHFEHAVTIVVRRSDSADRPILANAHYLLGLIALEERAHGEAEGHLTAARHYGNTEPGLAWALGTVYYELGRYGDALTQFSTLAPRDGTDPGVLYNLAAASVALGRQQLKNGRHGQAAKTFEEAREAFARLGAAEEEAEVVQVLGEALFRDGAAALLEKEGDAAHAVARLEQACALVPGRANWEYFLATAHFRQGNHARAAERFQALRDRGTPSPEIGHALALSLEKAGNEGAAEEAWNALRQSAAKQGQNLGRTGLASLYARRADWRRAAAMMHELVMSTEGEKGEVLAVLRKLAVSYCILGGDDSAAGEIIGKHFSSQEREDLDAYLGAVLARQDRLDESAQYLRKAAARPRAGAATGEIFEVVTRTRAARRVLDGDLAGAAGIMGELKSVPHRASPETAMFQDILAAAQALEGVAAGAAPDTDLWEKYHDAYTKNPGNFTLLQGLAILSDRMGIRIEGEGEGRVAHKYWEHAAEYWKKLTSDSRAFLENYVRAYNEGKDKRECVKPDEVEDLPGLIARRRAQMHVAFAEEFARRDDTDGVRRHVSYTRRAIDSPDVFAPLLGLLFERSQAMTQQEQWVRAYELGKLTHEIADDDIRRHNHAVYAYNYGIYLLNRDDEVSATPPLLEAKSLDAELAVKVDQQRALYHVVRAIEWINKGNGSAAESAYMRARGIYSGMESDMEIRPIAAQYYLGRAVDLLNRGNVGAGKPLLQRALELDPTIPFKRPDIAGICPQLGIPLNLGNAWAS